ncbi:MAG: HAMP domain-containing protein [Myxococcota bacterium]|nr:HAMP domain-containing protein [Myxococcota bacterium]
MSEADVSRGYVSPSKGPLRVQFGLRLQIVLALAGLMLLAFVPLFFAVASLTRATVLDAREHAARALGRAIALHVADARARGGPAAIQQTLDATMASGDVDSVCVFPSDGSGARCVGSEIDANAMSLSAWPHAETSGFVRGRTGRALEVVSQSGDHTIVARLRVDDAADRAKPLVRLVALYMVTFGLALLVFAYFFLTRVIVRPVEQLVEAADRVANGARTLRVPRSGAR